MVNIYKFIDILYFVSTFLLAMINFRMIDEKIVKDTKNYDRKDINWVSLDADDSDWGWLDDTV